MFYIDLVKLKSRMLERRENMKFKDDNTNYIDISMGNKEIEKITKRSNKLLEEELKDENNSSSDTNGNSGGESSNDEIEDIKQMGTPQMPAPAKKDIQCITIVGEIEGHFIGNPQKKSQERPLCQDFLLLQKALV